jgi:hypothetical protein
MQLQAKRQSSQYSFSELILPYLDVLVLCVLFDVASDQCSISRLPPSRLTSLRRFFCEILNLLSMLFPEIFWIKDNYMSF